MDQQIDFCTLGMFIIDDIEFAPPTPPVKDIIGGAGSYAALGARLFSPPPLSTRVGWILDAGNDCSAHLRGVVEGWRTSCLLRDTPWRPTTRGLNLYGANEERGFRYLTPKLRLGEDDLTETLLRSRSFHIICSPERCIQLVTNVNKRRQNVNLPPPLWVWEPVPDLCTPEQLQVCREAVSLVDILCPNHMELCSFFGLNPYRGDEIDRSVVEACAADLCNGFVVTRAGKDGCCVMDGVNTRWLPAYHTASRVVDPTGGGNTFCGSFAVVLARSEMTFEAVCAAAVAGNVGASFAIEQIGMPVLGEHETWNGDTVTQRLSMLS